MSMTFHEVGAPAHLSGLPSAATNIPRIQSTFDLESKEPRKGYEKIGRLQLGGYSDHSRPKIVQIDPVVRALEQFFHMQSECKQTLVPTWGHPWRWNCYGYGNRFDDIHNQIFQTLFSRKVNKYEVLV